MMSIKPVALISICIVAHATSVVAARTPDDRCPQQYSDLFKRMSDGLARSKGVETSWNPELIEDPRHVVRFRKDLVKDGAPLRALVFNREHVSNDLQAMHHLHHEAVHTTTDFKIRNEYTAEYAARGILFKKEGGKPISDLLPEEYSRGFINEERVAYGKGSIHARQVEDRGEIENTRILPSSIQKELSKTFEKIAKPILKSFRRRMQAELMLRVKSLDFEVYDFAEDAPDVIYAVFSRKQKDGGRLEIAIPVKIEGDLDNMTRRDIVKLALKVIEADR